MNIDMDRLAVEVLSFIGALCRVDSASLEQKWGMSPALIEEVQESLERYSDDETAHHFEGPPTLSPGDIRLAGADRNECAPIRLFESSQCGVLAVECDLWFKGRRSDLTALMDVYEREEGRYEIDFRMLEVQ